LGSARRAIHVVVTCSNRKRLRVPPSLAARNLPELPTARRANEWIIRLENTDAPLIGALDLYAGEHWSVVRSLPPLGMDARTPAGLWILSAGYGLISAEARIRPYGATFSSGHADTVGSNGSRRHWWKSLARWAGPEPGVPRSLEQLAEQDPNATILMAVSPPYLDACSDDVTSAVRALRTPAQLLMVCIGASRTTMPEHMLPGDARLQHVLGGTRQALNVRVLAHLLREHRGPLTREAASDALYDLLVRQPALVQHDRQRCSDTEVANYIRTHLRTDPSLTHSRLLRQFRNEGNACEQSRFASLFAAEGAEL
jgi:hypothetical protein